MTRFCFDLVPLLFRLSHVSLLTVIMLGGWSVAGRQMTIGQPPPRKDIFEEAAATPLIPVAAAAAAAGADTDAKGKSICCRRRQCITIGVTLLLAVFYALTQISGYVVQHHQALIRDSYKISGLFLVLLTITQGVTSTVYSGWRASTFELWRRLLPIKISGLFGACTAITVVCALVAGGVLAASEQTIFSQFQIVMIYVVTTGVYRTHRLAWYQHLIVGVVIACNVLIAMTPAGSAAAATATDDPESSAVPVPETVLVISSLLYITAALATGLSNSLIEEFYAACVVGTATSYDDDHDLVTEAEYYGGYRLTDFVLASNFIASIWSLVFYIPLFGVAVWHYGGVSEAIDTVVFDWSSFQSVGGLTSVTVMVMCASVYSASSSWLVAYTDALSMTVSSQMGVLFQLIVLNSSLLSRAFIGESGTGRGSGSGSGGDDSSRSAFHSSVSGLNWTINIILCAGSVIYAIGSVRQQSKKNDTRSLDDMSGTGSGGLTDRDTGMTTSAGSALHDNWIYRMYKSALESSFADHPFEPNFGDGGGIGDSVASAVYRPVTNS